MRFMSLVVAALTLGLLPTAPLTAETLPQLIDKLPPDSLQSDKSLRSLEYCIGVGMAKLWTVSTLDGENRVLIYSGPNILGGVQLSWLTQIVDNGDHRAVSLTARSDRERTKLEPIVRSCL